MHRSGLHLPIRHTWQTLTSAFAVVCVFYERGSRGAWIRSFTLRLQVISAAEVLNLSQKYHPSLWLLLCVASEKLKCSQCTSVEDVCLVGLQPAKPIRDISPLKSIDLFGCWNYPVNRQYISGFNTHITGIPSGYCCFYQCSCCYLTGSKYLQFSLKPQDNFQLLLFYCMNGCIQDRNNFSLASQWKPRVLTSSSSNQQQHFVQARTTWAASARHLRVAMLACVSSR